MEAPYTSAYNPVPFPLNMMLFVACQFSDAPVVSEHKSIRRVCPAAVVGYAQTEYVIPLVLKSAISLDTLIYCLFVPLSSGMPVPPGRLSHFAIIPALDSVPK